jgi:Fic family protein
LPPTKDIETKKILKKSISSNKALAKLNGIAKIIPNSNILINSLALQEAKDSSEIQKELEQNDAGVRKQSGTNLANAKTGRIINILYFSNYIIKNKFDYYRD